MEFTGIDHFVLTVEDIETTCEFYSALGADVVTYGEGRTALQFGRQKINLHPAGDEFEPKATTPTPGAGDFCVLIDQDIDAVEAHLAEADVDVLDGPVERTGATGPLISVYVCDPDGNLVELATSADGAERASDE